MSTLKMPEYETTTNNDNGVSYIVEGDVVLKTDTKPEEFWKKVGNAMGSRWSVTKHNRKN